MIKIICFLFPAILSSFLWEKVLNTEKRDLYTRVSRIAFLALTINLITLIVISFFSEAKISLVHSLENVSIFTAKFIILSTGIAIVLPYLFEFCKTRIKITYNKGVLKNRVNSKFISTISLVYLFTLIILNVVALTYKTFWVDEIYTINIIKQSVPVLLVMTASDVHPPLYYLYLKLFSSIFGYNEIVYTIGSLIPYFIMILLGAQILRKKYGIIAYLTFITFLSISQNAIMYNVEVRMYSLTGLLVLLSFFEFKKVIDGRKYYLFILYSLAAAYSHYYGIIAVAYFYLALLIRAFRGKFSIKKTLLIYLFTILGYIPWLSILLTTFNRASESWWSQEIPTFNISFNYYFLSDTKWFSTTIMVFLLAILIYLIIKDKGLIQLKREQKNYNILLFAQNNVLNTNFIWLGWGVISALGTAIIGIVVSMIIRPLFLIRFLSLVLPMLYFILSVLVSNLKYKKVWGTLIILLALFIYVPEYIDQSNESRFLYEQTLTTQQVLIDNISDDDVIITNQSHMKYGVYDYYVSEGKLEHKNSFVNNFEPNKHYWLLWNSQLNINQDNWINEFGYTYDLVHKDGRLSKYPVYLYKLKNK